MRKTLSKMVVATEPVRCNSTEQDLCPADEWHRFSDYAVRNDEVTTDPTLKTLLKVEFQVHAECNLDDQHEHQDIGE